VPAPLVEFRRAMNARDLTRLRGVLHADFVFDDHRRTGAGRLAGVDAYLPALRALWELSRDVQIEQIREIANAPQGFVSVGRTAGVNAEGGRFESFYVSVLHARDDRVDAIELFEPEDVDAALARFHSLGA
jgi:ketosteroid isomerase-like protein